MSNLLINSVEALLFGSGRPIRLSEIKNILENSGIRAELSEIKQAINNLEERYLNTNDSKFVFFDLYKKKSARIFSPFSDDA